MGEQRRTKRRYASEIYPYADEWEVRPLSVEVPHRYAEMVGTAALRTGWIDLVSTYPKGSPEASIAAQLTMSRIAQHLLSAEIACLADALSQGLTGDEAWSWAMSRVTDDMELAYERAAHYGIPFERIKPYPCGPEPDDHDHKGDPAPGGRHYVNRVNGKESEYPGSQRDPLALFAHQVRAALPDVDEPPTPRYRLTLTVTGNTLDEIERELVVQTRGGFLLDSDYYKRDEWEVLGGMSTRRMEHLNPTMTPDRYAQELDTWFQRRKSARRDGETR